MMNQSKKKKRPVVEVELSIAGRDIITEEGDSVLMVLRQGEGAHVTLAGNIDGPQELISILTSSMRAVLGAIDPDEYLPVLLTSVAGALVSKAMEAGLPESKVDELKEMLERQFHASMSGDDESAGDVQ